MIEEDDDIPLNTFVHWVGLTNEEIEQLSIDAGIITWVKRVYDDVDKNSTTCRLEKAWRVME
jgi:hypothetical protein